MMMLENAMPTLVSSTMRSISDSPPRDNSLKGRLCNAASDWVGSCAITIKRRRDRTPNSVRFNPEL